MYVFRLSFPCFKYYWLTLLLRPGGGAEYCDQPICLCACLSVCPRPYLWNHSSRNFVCGSPVAMARSSSGGVVLRYVLPVLWMTSRLAVMGATPKGGGFSDGDEWRGDTGAESERLSVTWLRVMFAVANLLAEVLLRCDKITILYTVRNTLWCLRSSLSRSVVVLFSSCTSFACFCCTLARVVVTHFVKIQFLFPTQDAL